MSTFLKAGDRLHVGKTLWDRLGIGDLVVLEASFAEYPIVHRLVGWQYRNHSRCGLLKGDSLPYTDGFSLTPDNYAGRVWALERRGKLVTLNSPYRSFQARCLAFLSVWNVTPALVRIKIKKSFERIIPLIPGIKAIERFIFKKARYFIFSGQENTKRICVAMRGMRVGEIIIEDNPQKAVSSKVFSVFSTFISPQSLTVQALKRFSQPLEKTTP